MIEAVFDQDDATLEEAFPFNSRQPGDFNANGCDTVGTYRPSDSGNSRRYMTRGCPLTKSTSRNESPSSTTCEAMFAIVVLVFVTKAFV
jgi:hypothetical protein